MCSVLISLLLCLLAGRRSSLALRFNNPLAYAIFNRWDASSNGTLLFEFKTHKENGFLIYEDDPAGMDFIDIFLVDGKVRMRLHIGQCVLKEVFVNGNFSDNKWHRLRVFRNFQTTILRVDHSSKAVRCGAHDSSFTVLSALYIGGFPLDISLNSLAFPGSFYDIYNGNRFIGCISGVKYSDVLGHFTPAILRNTSGTTADCNRACTRPYEFIMNCKHGKGCGNKIDDCDCLETGYEGQDCTRESTSVWLNGTGYIKYDLAKDSKSRTPARNYVGLRFRTSSQEGVLLHSSVRRCHLVLELVSGNIVFKMNLGNSKDDLMLIAGNRGLGDNRWHWVEVKRRGRIAKLSLDGREAVKGSAPGTALSKLVLKGGKEVIYFGGGPSKTELGRSHSKRNFSGYLQQFLFDEYKILDKVLGDEKDLKFTKHGLVLNGKVLTTVATPSSTVAPTTVNEASGSCGHGDSDDEDCVTNETVSHTPSDNTFSTSDMMTTTDSTMIYGSGEQRESGNRLGMPAWIITITVVASVVSIFITVLLVYRWNTRYSGSFSTASAIPKPEQIGPSWPERPSRIPVTITVPVEIEHPQIYVSCYDKV